MEIFEILHNLHCTPTHWREQHGLKLLLGNNKFKIVSRKFRKKKRKKKKSVETITQIPQVNQPESRS